jgi:flagellar export protein FliJ
MKKFNFSLKGLLKLREREELNEKIKLAKIIKKINEVSVKIDELRKKISISQTHLKKGFRESYSVESGLMHNEFIKNTEFKLKLLQLEQNEYEQAKQLQIENLTKARQAIKVVQVLKEKQLLSYKTELKKNEEKIEAEINSNLFLRSRK